MLMMSESNVESLAVGCISCARARQKAEVSRPCWCVFACLAGYVLPDPIQAKLNKKKGRYTFK